MSERWWWVWAYSPREIAHTYAELEVVGDPGLLRRAGYRSLEEADVDVPGSDPEPLADLRARRDAHRGQRGFGALVGRGTVYVRRRAEEAGEDGEDGEDAVFFLELGPDGRRTRQVEVAADGDAVATDPDDWPFNPPLDLYDPVWAPLEIARGEFEDVWRTARREDTER